MAAHFGDMLLNRRRQMGMSIQQVANTIKIRPQIIEFFENENFESMPPRGYAQGMISSYARFLGLNPREVVNAYFDDLVEYERNSGSSAGKFQEGAGIASARSSTAQGRFMMVDGGRTDISRYGQRPLQAGYATESGSGKEIREMRARVRKTLPPAQGSVPRSYAAASHDPREGYGDGGYGSSARMSSGRAIRRTGDRGDSRGRNASGRVLDGSSNRGVSTRGTSRGSRGSVNRMNAQRASGYQQRGGSPSRGSYSRVSNSRGAQSFIHQLDRRFLIAGIVLILLVVVGIFMLVRGCSSSAAATNDSSVQATTSVSSNKSKNKKASSASDDVDASESDSSTDDTSSDVDESSSDSSTDSDENPDSSEGTSSANDGADGTSEEITAVKVSVAKNKTAWVEVKVDGKSVYAAQATGPFSQEFTPTSSIEITTSKPTYVTIKKNGKKVRYDTKTSGVARVTITVPKTESTSTDADTSAIDGNDAASAMRTGTDTSGTTDATTAH